MTTRGPYPRRESFESSGTCFDEPAHNRGHSLTWISLKARKAAGKPATLSPQANLANFSRPFRSRLATGSRAAHIDSMLVLTSTVSDSAGLHAKLVADGGFMCLGRAGKEQAAGEEPRTHSLLDQEGLNVVSGCHLLLRAVSAEDFEARSLGMNGTLASSGATGTTGTTGTTVTTKLTKGEWVRLAAGTTLTLGPARLKAKRLNPFSFVVSCCPAPGQAAPEATRLSSKRPASPRAPADVKRQAAGSSSTSREPPSPAEAAEAAEAAGPPPAAAEASPSQAEATDPPPTAESPPCAEPPPSAEPSRLPYAFRLTPVAAGWGLPSTAALNAEALDLRAMLSEEALRGATEVQQ